MLILILLEKSKMQSQYLSVKDIGLTQKLSQTRSAMCPQRLEWFIIPWPLRKS